MFGLAVFLVLVSAHTSLATSTIATFSDSNCTASLEGFDGPNGYPNGTCTDIRRRSSSYNSFQVISLDPGCTVTIYEDDHTGDMCSGTSREIDLVDCYNSTYIYYSIDFCDPYATQSSSLALPTSSSTSLPTSSTSSIAETPSKSNINGVVGGVIGGAIGLIIGLIVGLAAYLIRRKRRQKIIGDNPAQVYELVSQQRRELASHEKNTARFQVPPTELEAPAVELAGHERK